MDLESLNLLIQDTELVTSDLATSIFNSVYYDMFSVLIVISLLAYFGLLSMHFIKNL